MEQYFSSKPASKDDVKSFEFIFADNKFGFFSSNGVFSKKYVDFGTELLISSFVKDNENVSLNGSKIIDAGCGIGIVGIVLGRMYPGSKLILFDINERAVVLAKENAAKNAVNNIAIFKSDLFTNVIGQDYDFILSNPPIRAGKEIVFRLYEEALKKLKIGGVLYVVIRKKQGALSSKQKLIELFGNCSVIYKKSGYKILKSVREE